MPKTFKCEVCGKEVNIFDSFTKHGKKVCHDCAYSKNCKVCGRLTPPDEICQFRRYDVCADCAFPIGGIKEYNSFKEKLKELNLTNETEHKRADRKRRLKILCIGSLISLAILFLAIVLFKANDNVPKILEIVLAVCLSGSILATIIGAVRKREFIPMTETEYYNSKYSKIQ